MPAFLVKIIGDRVLKVDDGGGGFFAGFKTWLMTGVDLDLGGVKTQSMFEKAMRRRTENGETDFIVIVVDLSCLACKSNQVSGKRSSKSPPDITSGSTNMDLPARSVKTSMNVAQKLRTPSLSC